MSGITIQFSEAPLFNEFDKITGSASALQLPDKPCLMARFKAYNSNYSTISLGATPGTCTYSLAAGDDTGWIALQNLNQLWHQAVSGASDYFSYWLQK